MFFFSYGGGIEIDVFVLGVDKDNLRISLGMKQLQPDPWVEVNKLFKVGEVVTGQIVRLVPFGAFIRIGDIVEGLIHISELSHEHVKEVSDIVSVGQEVEAKIIKLIPEDQKIGLTLKNIKEDIKTENSTEESTSSEETKAEDSTEESAPSEEAKAEESTEESKSLEETNAEDSTEESASSEETNAEESTEESVSSEEVSDITINKDE